MPPAGRNSPLHKFSDLCKGRISLSVAEGSKLPDGKMFSHPTNWCCFSVVRVRSICNPYIVYSHRLLQICFSIVKTTDHLPPGKEFYFFIQAFTSVLLTIEFFFQSFFPVAGGRWSLSLPSAVCRAFSLAAFCLYSPFSRQTLSSASPQTLQSNVSFNLSPNTSDKRILRSQSYCLFNQTAASPPPGLSRSRPLLHPPPDQASCPRLSVCRTIRIFWFHSRYI